MKRTFFQLLGIDPVVEDRDAIEDHISIRKAEDPSVDLQQVQRVELLGTLAGGLAHDLHNILAPILHATDNLQLLELPDEAKGQISAIRQSAARAKELVRQILAFSRGGGTELELLDPKTVINELTQLVRETFPKNIAVKASARAGLLQILSEPTQLLQILLNLCVNSRDAMPNGGVLSIVAENRRLDAKSGILPADIAEGHFVRISVADTGVGMSPDVQKRIFEPYFTTKPVGKGTGLGLSVVHGLAKAHKGFVTVSSAVGRGTEISVFFPAIEQISPSESAAHLGPLNVSKGKTILLIDDEPVILATLGLSMRKMGYKVVTAASGREALRIVSENESSIDAVLTDIMMPDMSGWDTISRIRSINPNKPIVALSGVPKYYRAEFSDDITFLQKPASFEELAYALEETMRRKPAAGSH